MKPLRLGRAPAVSAAAGPVRAVFPLSRRGLAFTALAAALLGVGLARADLAALFWGSSFILYSLYALAGSHLSRLILKRRRAADPELVSILMPSAGMEPGGEAEAHLSADLPRAFPPGFLVSFSLPLRWHERVLSTVRSPLGPGKSRHSVRFRAARRGLYRSDAAFLEISDVLGFTRNRLPVPLAESLAVWPSPGAEGPWRVLAEGENPAASTSRRRRSEELLEVRKYYPGDDVRRLNWKVFAHSRELFLRIGEETPPPESRLLFILDSSANPLIPRLLSDDYLDALVDSCAAAMLTLAAEGAAVLLCRPGARECRAYSEQARSELMSALADVWWADESWRPALPPVPRLHCAVFSTPGSPGLGQILAQVRDRGWTTSLFLKEAPRRGESKGLRLRDILFVPVAAAGANASRGAPAALRDKASALAARRAHAALEEAMAQDLVRYSGAGWRVSHAREV